VQSLTELSMAVWEVSAWDEITKGLASVKAQFIHSFGDCSRLITGQLVAERLGGCFFDFRYSTNT
jgi:hypothetical protein